MKTATDVVSLTRLRALVRSGAARSVRQAAGLSLGEVARGRMWPPRPSSGGKQASELPQGNRPCAISSFGERYGGTSAMTTRQLTVAEAAGYLNVSERWVRRAVFEKRFETIHLDRLSTLRLEIKNLMHIRNAKGTRRVAAS
jgi:hypothetical protein